VWPRSGRVAGRPLHETDACSTKVLIHSELRELARSTQPVGVEVIDRQSGWILLDQNKRGTVHEEGVGYAQTLGYGSSEMRFSRSECPDECHDRAREQKLPNPTAETLRARQIGDLDR
jgi:hypothetical protein